MKCLPPSIPDFFVQKQKFKFSTECGKMLPISLSKEGATVRKRGQTCSLRYTSTVSSLTLRNVNRQVRSQILHWLNRLVDESLLL
jgi:hypothetical protein